MKRPNRPKIAPRSFDLNRFAREIRASIGDETPATLGEEMGRSVIADGLRVIVADDIASVRLLLRSTLPLHGIEIAAEAGTGAEVIELAKVQQPDAIVLDIHMPDMSGMDVVSRLKNDNPSCKIVMYSNYDEPQVQDEALARGADAYVGKLAPVSEVAVALERVCEPSGRDLAS